MDLTLYKEWYDLESRHWWFVGRRAIFRGLIETYLKRYPARILDVGCGTGVNMDHLEPLGNVVGADPSRVAIEYCLRRKPYCLVQATMSELPLADGAFDLVTAFDVIEHDPDDALCLKETYRVCSSGGLLVLSVPAYRFMWGAHDRVAHHRRRYCAGEVRGVVEGAGFAIVRLTYLNTILFPVAVVFRRLKDLLGRVRPRAPERSDFRSTGLPLVNWILLRVFSLERLLVARWNLPFGLTIACVARKILDEQAGAEGEGEMEAVEAAEGAIEA